jgi:hypothetical protein
MTASKVSVFASLTVVIKPVGQIMVVAGFANLVLELKTVTHVYYS